MNMQAQATPYNTGIEALEHKMQGGVTHGYGEELFHTWMRCKGRREGYLAAKAEDADLLEKLLALVEECFVCPSCGPLVRVDGDGCCVTCGADTITLPTGIAWAEHIGRDEGRTS